VENHVSLSLPPFAINQTLLSPALFTLDKNGLILAANSNALHFWQTTASHLTGTSFARLFVFDGTSVASAGADAQWGLLLANTLDRTIACETRLPGNVTMDVGVRIEESQGGIQGYFAVIEDPTRHLESSPPLLLDSGLALLADEGAVGFFDLNFKAKQMYYSPAWKKLLGYTDQELANNYDSWQRLIHPDDSAAAPDHAPRKPKPGASTFSVEMRMLHSEGHYLWVQCLGTQIIGPEGELERVSGIQIDINERKELDEQSQLNDERLQKLTSNGALLSFDFDFSHGKFWLSPGWKKLAGENYDQADSELDLFLKALPEAVALRGAEAFFLANSPEHETFIQATALRGQSPQPFPVLLGANRQLTRKGGLARAVGFCCPLPADLVANLAAVSTLPIPAALVADTIASVSEAIIVADGRGRVVFLNQQAERLTGCKLSDSLGTPLADVFRLAKRGSGQPDSDALDLALAASDRSTLCANHSIQAADGKLRPVAWSVRQILSSESHIDGIVVVFRDPEEMKLTPEELITINRWESLGVIAGGISHDFNNLLTTILGGISHAKDNNDNSYLADSERACLAAKALTKQLLAAAKGGGGTTSQVISPADVLEESVRLARAGATAIITLNASSTVAPIRVNHAQMMQVFQNLIINALQAVPATGGTIAISAENTKLAEGELLPLPAGNYVSIEIKDNGAGISRENLDKIFEQFFTTKKHGTGLGLSTVRSIVRKHGGHIRVSSTVGEGTVFRILLPQADQPAETETRRTPILRTGTGRVLLMDDDPDISRLAAGMLASLDYKYDVARNGEDAIALYHRYMKVGRPYDLVILDLTVIGGMGGEEAFRKLREIDKDVRAIVCSGYDSDEMARQYMEMGFVGYLSKPFRLGDLARAIKGVLG
jgi:PAS domain S-box-containing protein